MKIKLIKLGVAAMANVRFLIVWPEKGAVMRNVPKTLKRTGSYKNTYAIIHCSEILSHALPIYWYVTYSTA